MKYVCVLLLLVVFDMVYSFPAQNAFARDQLDRQVICKLPAVRGHCRALLPRWRYNPATGRCHEFNFGGCDGNGNNFMEEADCMAVCGGVRM